MTTEEMLRKRQIVATCYLPRLLQKKKKVGGEFICKKMKPTENLSYSFFGHLSVKTFFCPFF
jgi:hypothetical protein